MAARIASVFRPALFKGKSAIVTGGGTGIGKIIAQELLYLGCNVMIASRNKDRLDEAAVAIRDKLPDDCESKLEVVSCNIRHEDQVKQMVETHIKTFGDLSFLVNNGGGQFFSKAEEFSLKGWNAVVETNLTGTFLCTKEAYNQWMMDHGGVIVNMVANMWNGWPGMSHSGAARAGIDNLTKSLAVEWAPSGVRINCVAPGSTIYSETANSNYKGMSIFHKQIPRVPAKRLGKAEEVSAAVCFLLSPAAAFITGTTIKIDGGQSLYTTSVPWEVPEHSKLPAYSWDKTE